MPDKNTYIESLRWRLEQIKREILKHQEDIQTLFKHIEEKQAQVQHLTQLLATEGQNLEDPELAGLTNVDLANSAYDYLNSQNSKDPLHYTEIAKALMSRGILIPGKNPPANLLSHISRDNRFVRTAPGTYGLRSWELKPAAKRKSKKGKKR